MHTRDSQTSLRRTVDSTVAGNHASDPPACGATQHESRESPSVLAVRLITGDSTWELIIDHPTSDQRHCAERGLRAGIDWLPPEDNPYRLGTKRWRAWRNGWMWVIRGQLRVSGHDLTLEALEEAVIAAYAQHMPDYLASAEDRATESCMQCEDVEAAIQHLVDSWRLHHRIGKVREAGSLAQVLFSVMTGLNRTEEATRWRRVAKHLNMSRQRSVVR